MRFERAFIPLGAAWSTPFSRWQGSLASLSSLDVAADVTRRALADRGVDPASLTNIALGMTIPQPEAFYATPSLAYRIGAPTLGGPMIAQACATSAAVLSHAAQTVEGSNEDELVLAVTADRTSNGPHLVYPTGAGRVQSEDWVLDNFARDPLTGKPMVETAERVAREAGFSRAQLDDMTLLRSGQYQRALAGDRAFQRRYFVPVEVPGPRGTVRVVDADEGVRESTKEGLAALAPTVLGGVVTAGSQTHPADGAAGMLVTTRPRALSLSNHGVAQILSVGTGRAELGAMPKAPVLAAGHALRDAGVEPGALDVVTTHNPFVVNDLWLCRELGLDPEVLNPYGSSLIYGHPQAPTGMRAMAELIEALTLRGGGTGLFTGCAAGDSAVAVVLRVELAS
ncbi:thiolase family protein [Paenarthrobacter aurescens]|uniref:thiolase family protein n=1 Tax=Paenarthrobacter aurescens TaxID=43663 RepID=UPI0021C1159A|nr:thiolase family protein [Paenarthrobacter aurescens]MCT9870417.1 thiolase family protein [Paenarthrobacter aurescens]